MCGFAGIGGNLFSSFDTNAVLTRMGDAIAHRGPDDFGIWIDERAGVGLVHRRLSILDLSPAGHQPMASGSGRYVMAFNGEIYNHSDLRADLVRDGVAPQWRGHSDTETLLAGFDAWGIEETLRRSVGMFALAVFDRAKGSLILARDRLGEKPLYYGQFKGAFVFASEPKAFRQLPGFDAEVDRDALALFVRYNYIPSPRSIFKDIRKLPPATLMEVPLDAIGRYALPEPAPYWSARTAALDGIAYPLAFDSEEDAADALEALLTKAIGQQMIADVPLGAFLSGGVDSSTVVALMQKQSSRPVKSFTIGFSEEDHNEAEYAKAVAEHLGAEHTELYVTPADALSVIPKLPEIYCEPFSDSSQIPTFLVSRMARQHVTVSLSGDGGDELFGGYTRYFLAARLWSKIARLPSGLRRAAGALLSVSPGAWDRFYRASEGIIPARLRLPGDRIHRGAALLKSDHPSVLYHDRVSHWDGTEIVLGAKINPATEFKDRWPDFGMLPEQMMAFDSTSYLPDDILVKVDRAAMAVSLESRAPFLDHRVYEFAWRLRLGLKLRDGQGKWLLRKVLYRHVPPSLIDRPKMGFGVPIAAWLRGPLCDWAEDLLSEKRLREDAFFEPGPIRKRWAEHLTGSRNWQYHLWDILMFQAWHDSNRALPEQRAPKFAPAGA
jgi:asparagine synthase (glutamine-hydrolysing)